MSPGLPVAPLDLHRLVAVLGAAQVEFVMVGSAAAWMHGASRRPNDLDVVIRDDWKNFEAVADAMTQAVDDQPLREIPLFVISAGLPFDISEADLGFSPDAWQDAWSTAQAQLAMLLPDARHVIAEESGHIVHLQQPELVIEAIRQVVEAVRDPHTWAAERAAPVSSAWPP